MNSKVKNKAKEMLEWFEFRDGRCRLKKDTPEWVKRVLQQATSIDDKFGLEMLYHALSTIVDYEDEDDIVRVLEYYVPVYNSDLLEWLNLRRAYYVDDILGELGGIEIRFFDLLKEAYLREQLEVYHILLKELENEENKQKGGRL